jgi:uncharacterized protein YpmS
MFEATFLTQISFVIMFASMVIIGALIVLPGAQRRFRKTQQRRQLEAQLATQPEQRLKQLIKYGIEKESRLEEIYRCVHDDAACLEGFPEGQQRTEAKQLLQLLHDESHQHKVTLQQILISIQ